MIAVAGGVFAPGHLGELAQVLPFEMVDAVLAEAGGSQQRVRKLPSRVVVYLLLAAGLFAEVGYLGMAQAGRGPGRVGRVYRVGYRVVARPGPGGRGTAAGAL